ncbi:MAG: response regulator transcription factor [Candidatus Dadabacteria bacterium]
MYPLVKKILIADDHPLIRRALKMLITHELQITSIVEVDNYNALLLELTQERYTHLILDIMLSDTNSAEQFAALRKQFPGLAVMVYSMHPEEVYGSHLIKLGARCYLNKQTSDEELVKCLKDFFSGKKCVSATLNNVVTENMENPFSSLSQRELEVLQFLLTGNGIKEIAAIMDLRANTVATFKARIFEKLHVKNILELSQLAGIYHITYS